MAKTTTIVRPKMSLTEFLSLPEDDTSPVKYELEFGELVEVERPNWVVDMERKTVEEYRWTKERYLLTQVVLSNEVFQPKAFHDLTIYLQALFGIEGQEVKADEKKSRH